MGSSLNHTLFFGNFHFTQDQAEQLMQAIFREETTHGYLNQAIMSEGFIEENESHRNKFVCIEDTLQQLGVSYKVVSGDDCEFDEVTWWSPGMTDTITVDASKKNGPVVPFAELKLLLTASDPMAALVTLLATEPPVINKPTYDETPEYPF